MVKSNVEAMVKPRRKLKLPPELQKELAEIKRRIVEHDREAEKTLAAVAALRARLREIYSGS